MCMAVSHATGNAYLYSNPGAGDFTTTYMYNSFMQLVSTTTPGGHTTKYTPDLAGNVLAVTDPSGYVTTNAYDSENRLCATEQTYGTAATLSCGSWQSGETQYSYHANTSAYATVEGPDGHTTSYTYSNPDVPTSPTTVTDALGNVTSTVYDTAGNVCLTGVGNLWSGSTPPTCTWQQGYILTSYDPIGRKTETEDQSGNKTTYSYGDPLYPTQPTQMVLPGGATSTVSYNLDGETATSTDAPNSTISYGYDLLGLKCWQAPTTSTGSCTAPPKVTGLQTFAYYNSGSLASTTNVGAAGTKTASYTYDAQQNLLSNTNENGQTVSYAYPDGGQVSCIGYPIKFGGQTSNCAKPPSSTNAAVDYT